MEKEIWKDIDGYGGQYQVSNLGRVRSFRIKSEGVILVQRPSIKGYMIVCLNHVAKSVHQLVARAFVGGYADGLEVNHINEDKADNRAENLEWVTHRQNNLHGTRVRRVAEALSKRAMAIDQFDLDGNYIKTFPNCRSAASAVGVHKVSIYRVCQGKEKSVGGYRWAYNRTFKVEKKVPKPYPRKVYDTTSLEGEQWAQVEGYNGLYWVSNLGRVKSVDHKTANGKFRPGRIMKSEIVTNKKHRGPKYVIVNLFNGKRGIPTRLCNLVARSFVSGYADGMEVNHIDGDVTNNRADNLEWATRRRKVQIGTRKENSLNVANRKTVVQMTLDGEFVAEYASLNEAGKAVGKEPGNISRACVGRQNTAYGYKWKFKNNNEKK